MKILLALALLLLAAPAWPQTADMPFDKRSIPDKAQLKRALGLLAQADVFYESPYATNYDSACHYFREALSIHPHSAEVNLKVGHCYLMLSSGTEPEKAMPYLDRAEALDPALKGQVLYYKGRAWHLQGEWRKAANFYLQYEDLLDPETDAATLDQVRRRLQECRSGEELSASPIAAKLENMGDWVNTPYREHSPIISANASVLYFTSRRPDAVGGERDMDGLYFEDLYVAFFREGSGWTRPRNVGAPVNTDLHDATVSLSADGKQLIIMREGDLYESRMEGESWTTPVPFPKNINGKSSFETAASYADDGQTLYFVSDRRESFGGKDIFVSKRLPEGGWSDPANLGLAVNTPYDENGVFMHPDGATLYFSSEGHNSMGGTDIFKCVKTAEGWSAPVNMGAPLNTPYDEQCLVVSADYKHGYYSTKGKGSLGDHDLFRVTFLDTPEPLAMLAPEAQQGGAGLGVKPVALAEGMARTLLAGQVQDFADGKPLAATVRVERLRDGREVAEVVADAGSGRVLIALPTGESYRLVVRAKGYLYHAETLLRLGEDGRGMVPFLAKIKPIIPDQTLVMKDVFFERASAKLEETSYEELRHLAQVLRENPGLDIEIGGHTDNLGNPARLQKLSQLRAQAVRDYLVSQGIDGGRLVVKGYGGERPIADNSDPEARALNRRVEFKVLRID